MNKTKKRRIALAVQLTLCMGMAAFTAYSVIDNENKLTQLRRRLPEVERELRLLEEENRSLHYAIDSFESPLHLMELAKKPEFGHLHYPYNDDVIVIEEEEQ